MTDLEALRERVRSATGPDFEAACRLHWLLLGERNWATAMPLGTESGTWSEQFVNLGGPAYTSSLDEALHLTVRLLLPRHPMMTVSVRGHMDGVRGHWWKAEITWPSTERQGHGHTASLAVIDALLSALIAQKVEG